MLFIQEINEVGINLLRNKTVGYRVAHQIDTKGRNNLSAILISQNLINRLEPHRRYETLNTLNAAYIIMPTLEQKQKMVASQAPEN